MVISESVGNNEYHIHADAFLSIFADDYKSYSFLYVRLKPRVARWIKSEFKALNDGMSNINFNRYSIAVVTRKLVKIYGTFHIDKCAF